VPSLATLSQVRQSDAVEEPFARAVVGSPFRTERRSLILRVTARTLLRTGCKTASTVRPLVAFRQFVCRKTGTSRKSRLECDPAPNPLPEATAALGCFFGAMTPFQTRWQLGPRYRAPAPLLVRIAGDARYSGAGHAGGLPTVS